MGMRVSDFSRMAGTGGGSFRVDSGSGKLTVGNKGFFGKVAGWFRMKSDPGKVQGENMSAMNAFIRAISMDPKYGPAFANMATTTLTPLLERGKPLTSRLVRQIVGSIQKQQGQINGLNRMLGTRFSEYDSHGDPNCFGSVFANVCGEKGFNVPLAKLDVSRLKEAIQGRVEEAGQNGQHAVSIQEAKQIARQEIERFVDGKQTLFTSIGQLETGETQKTALRDLVCKFAHISKPEYLQQVLNLEQAGHQLFASLSKPDCTRVDVMKAMATYNEAYGKVFEQIRQQASGADDVIRFGGDALDLALMTSGLGTDAKQRLYALLTSQECRELRSALGYIGNNQSSLREVEDSDAAATAAVMGRSQEFISELATTLGLSLGMTRERTFDALEKPPIYYSNWTEVPKDVGDFAKTLGATVPTGLQDIHNNMETEYTRDRDHPDVFLRGDTTASKLIKSFLQNHGKPCLDHAKHCLDQAKEGGGKPEEVYQRFLTAFLGGTTPREVLTFVTGHPEIFGSARELARDLHAQGLDIASPRHAFYAVLSSIFLRGIGPALTFHDINPTDSQPSFGKDVCRLLQTDASKLQGDGPNPLLLAFYNTLVREDANPERLDNKFNDLSTKLLAHKTDAANDPTGPLHAPQGFAREVMAFQQTLQEMRDYCEEMGLDFSQTFPNVDGKMVSVVSHLSDVVKPSNLLLSELSRHQVGDFEATLKSLGVDYPTTPFETEKTTRLTPLRNEYQQAIGNLATAVRGGNPQQILQRLREMEVTGQHLLDATNELGGGIDDPDKLKTFRVSAFLTALTQMPQNDVLDLLGALNLSSTRILQDGLVEGGYGVLQRDDTLGKQVLTSAIGLGELRDVTTNFLKEHGVSLPPLPDTKEYGLSDLTGPQRTALRTVFGIAYDGGGKVWVASGQVNEQFVEILTNQLASPLDESERTLQTIPDRLREGETINTGVTGPFWRDYVRLSTYQISGTNGTNPLFVTDGWDELGHEGREIRLLDGIRQLRAFCGNDPDMLHFVTQYSHQGIIAGILKACGDGNATPLRLPDGRGGFPMANHEHVTYTFSRNESGDITVRVNWDADSLLHLATPDGETIALDPNNSRCQFSFEVTFTRDKEVILSGPVTFDYDIKAQ